MGGGRKNLKRGTEEKSLSLEDGQCIVQVVSLRGSNLIEVVLTYSYSIHIKMVSFIYLYHMVTEGNGCERGCFISLFPG